MKQWMVRILAFLLLGFAGLAQGDAGDEGGLPAKLEETIAQFYATIEAGDAETRLELFSDDAILMPNHWTMIRGKQAIAEVLRSAPDRVFRLRDREVVDLGVDGGVAYTVNSYFYTSHRKGEDPQWHKTKNVHIWKRLADGSWKLHVDIWNSDVLMDQFSEE